MTTTAVKEKPVIFSTPMVKAILAGTKFQTRRVVKPQPEWKAHEPGSLVAGGWAWNTKRCALSSWPDVNDEFKSRLLEYGPYQVGDRLWVKETFDWCGGQQTTTSKDGTDTKRIWLRFYRADNTVPASGKWTSPLFMPRWLSRLTLEITDVRVQRIQEISAKDILAEGAVDRPHHDEHLGKCPVSAFDGCCYPDLKSLWAAGWDSINGKKHPWKDNPWVWAISFRRVTTTEQQS
jgi:hypothetical protein